MNEWYEKAKKKLADEKKAGKYDRYAAAMKDKVCGKLELFCRQEEEFAQAVVQGGTFADCMKAVAKNCGASLDDEEAYRRAVRFYFPGADVRFHMTVNLCASVEEGDEAAPAPEAAQAVKRKPVIVDLEDYL